MNIYTIAYRGLWGHPAEIGTTARNAQEAKSKALEYLKRKYGRVRITGATLARRIDPEDMILAAYR